MELFVLPSLSVEWYEVFIVTLFSSEATPGYPFVVMNGIWISKQRSPSKEEEHGIH
jgi:hypothetical protein